MTELEILGEELKRRRLAERKQFADNYQRHLRNVADRLPMLAAIIAENRGDAGAIVRLLRSEQSLTADDRAALAQYLEGGFDEARRTGAPKGNVRGLADAARDFVREWKKAAKARGVTSHGKTEWMRLEAIDFYKSVFPFLADVSTDAVLTQIDRGKSRQN